MEIDYRESNEGECVQFAGQNWKSHFENCDIFFAACVGEQVVGIATSATVGFDGKTIPMFDVVEVLEEYRGNGIGVQLSIRVIQRLIELGCEQIDYDAATKEGHHLLKAILKARPEFQKHLVYDDVWE